jgi:hypothetical protein
MAAQMAENPKGNEPMARAVVLIFAISEVLLDLSSTARFEQHVPARFEQHVCQLVPILYGSPDG